MKKGDFLINIKDMVIINRVINVLATFLTLLSREEENKEELKTAKEKRKEGLRDEERKYRPHVPPFFGL